MSWRDVHPVVVSFLVGVHLLQQVIGNFPPFISVLPERDTNTGVQDQVLIPPPYNRMPLVVRWLPKKKHLKPKKLLRRLKHHFNPEWMSVDRPTGPEFLHLNKPDPELAESVKFLNFTLSDPSGEKIVLNETVATALRAWLVSQGSCPVEFEWKDLGVYFWPRWIKHGKCVGRPSCSWPPGMYCVPAEHRKIRILRWHCLSDRALLRRSRRSSDSNQTEKWAKAKSEQKDKDQKGRCKWKKVHYPVVDECYCSC